MEEGPRHVPVLLDEVLRYLAPRPDGWYADVTAGLGGYAVAIAARLTTGRLAIADRDGESLVLARRALEPWADRICVAHVAFSGAANALRDLGMVPLDGMVADLGVSRWQLTAAERGFSFSADGPLDMRMDRRQEFTAADLVNTWDEKTIAELLWNGEERRARAIARAIVRARPIRSTLHLANTVAGVFGPAARAMRVHPATLTFQCIRREVNAEQGELRALLQAAPGLLRSGGRFVIVAFHSLEDRAVKQAFQQLARDGRAVILTKHVVKPSEQEVERNLASRSGRLRALEMR